MSTGVCEQHPEPPWEVPTTGTAIRSLTLRIHSHAPTGPTQSTCSGRGHGGLEAKETQLRPHVSLPQCSWDPALPPLDSECSVSLSTELCREARQLAARDK